MYYLKIHIDKLEKQNATISVNIFGAEDKGTYYEISETQGRKNEIDLLLINNKKEGSLCSSQHYCLIKSFNRFVSSQVSKHDGKKYICRRCLNPFNSYDWLNMHIESCKDRDALRGFNQKI